MADIQYYKHVKVPGFGCTYPHDFKDKNGTCAFEIRRLVRDEVVAFDHNNPCLVAPFEAGRGIVTGHRGANYDLDFERFLLLPTEGAWQAQATTPSLKLILIEVAEALRHKAEEEYGLSRAQMHHVFSMPRLVVRTIWINELFHRYAYERAILQKVDSASAQFLEMELVKEVFYAVTRPKQDDHNVPFFVELPEELRKALTFMEKKLHETVSADDIAAAAVVSKSTLVRLFRNHLGTSPVKYLWGRRLDEADRLLATGRYTVSEVGVLFGFSDTSSFSKSFAERFGARPSARRPDS